MKALKDLDTDCENRVLDGAGGLSPPRIQESGDLAPRPGNRDAPGGDLPVLVFTYAAQASLPHLERFGRAFQEALE